MSRSRKSTAAAVGHNSKTPLTDEEREALGVHHQLKITEGQRKLAVAMAEVASCREVVNGHFKRMTADLQFTRKDFQGEVLDKLAMTEGEYQAHVKKVDSLHRIAGLKKGDQLDLLEHVLDTVDESEAAFQDGYRAGRRADDPTPPKHVSPVLHTKWLEGWHNGQAYNGMQLGKAADILARPKVGAMAPAEPEGEGGDDEDGVDDGVKALKDSGWAGPTSQEQTFEETDNGRTVRRPRATKAQDAAAA